MVEGLNDFLSSFPRKLLYYAICYAILCYMLCYTVLYAMLYFTKLYYLFIALRMWIFDVSPIPLLQGRRIGTKVGVRM